VPVLAGIICAVAGAALLLASLAPMLGLGRETSTVTQSIADPIIAISSSTGGAGPEAQGAGSGSASGVITDGPVNGVAFEMAVPRLGYKATVLEGVSTQVLDRAPGHYPDSAWPGRAGNVAIAAHNVYWLSFNRLRDGDRVEIRTRHGVYVYEVTGSKVVSPTDGSVLAQTPDHRLTLTTCYPLWAGALATQRLIFFAHEIGATG
jgi:sortase A